MEIYKTLEYSIQNENGRNGPAGKIVFKRSLTNKSCKQILKINGEKKLNRIWGN
jgi:hypothetical protein